MTTTYKVWLEIECYDEDSETAVTIDAPGAALVGFDTAGEAYAFAESLYHAFSICRPKASRQSAATQVPNEVLPHIEQLLDYLFYDELQDCKATAWNDRKRQNAHIFSSLANLRNWLDGTPHRDVQWWLKNG